jgi:hypothetical protein
VPEVQGVVAARTSTPTPIPIPTVQITIIIIQIMAQIAVQITGQIASLQAKGSQLQEITRIIPVKIPRRGTQGLQGIRTIKITIGIRAVIRRVVAREMRIIMARTTRTRIRTRIMPHKCFMCVCMCVYNVCVCVFVCVS